MNITAFILFIFGLQAICLYVGGKSVKGLKNQEDYFLAGRGIRFFPLTMTFLATQVGGGLILGSANEAYQFGWWVLFYPLGAALGMILLGMGLGRRLAQFKVSTTAQIFEVAYRSPRLKKVASLLSILSLFMIFVAQIIASNKFMVSLGLDSPLVFLAFWGIVIFYTAAGGLKAVVATDIIQATFFVGAFLLCFGCALFSADISLGQIVDRGVQKDLFSFEPSKLYGWLLMPLLFMVIEQDMGQRCFAAESPQAVSRAALWAAGGTLMMSFIAVFFGVFAKSLAIEIPAGASVLMTVVTQTSSPVISAMIGCALLAAIVSTADSLINAIGSNLSQDFELKFLKRDNIRLSQALSAGIAIAGILFSFYFNNIVDVLIQSYELSVSCLFVPIFIALFKRKGDPLSAGLAVTFGALSFVLFKVVPNELPSEVISVLISLAGYYVGELVVWMRTQREEREKVRL